MNVDLSEQLDAFFRLNDGNGDNLIDNQWYVELGYAFPEYGGVVFRVKPFLAAEILSSVDHEDNLLRREDVAFSTEGHISPVSVTFKPLDPSEDNIFDGGMGVPVIPQIRLSFGHVNSSSHIEIGVDSAEALSNGIVAEFFEVDNGPTLQQFIEHIRGKQNWSELSFVEMMQGRSFGLRIPDFTGGH